MMTTESNIRHILHGLGRATKRGVRKCPECHTFNGTRGTKCKNKMCDHIFKRDNNSVQQNDLNDNTKDQIGEDWMSTKLESIRCITTNNSSNIYSVRVRNRGPDYRGFVEVPIIRGLDGTSDPSLNAQFIAETTARCFVEVCRSHKVVLPITGHTDSSITTTDQNCHHKTSSNTSNIRYSLIESCIHIKHSVKCMTEAKVLALKNSILNQLLISDQMRQQIAELAFDTPGPLVQRVSKTSMVVKCKPNNKQPLGYLHCWFAETSTNKCRQRSVFQNNFSCVCKAFKAYKCVNQLSTDCHSNSIVNNNEMTNLLVKSNGLSAERKCIHYYACICAFASDPKSSLEFKDYIIKELPHFECLPIVLISQTNSEQTNTEMVSDSGDCLAEKRIKSDENANSDVINTKKLIDSGIITETDVSINFIGWLSSVTELINQSMHYQLNGKPEPLVFMIPQGYFDCLQQRIATGLRKKRLPNVTTVFTRKDKPPLGTFTKYTFVLTNIHHIKQIFDTSKQTLCLQQNFVQNRDGSYDFDHSFNDCHDLADISMDGSALVLPQSDTQIIKRNELKTFLKVGLMGDSDPKESAIPFAIEWIPDCLPVCHFGELRIELQFGHIRNGKIENC
ncbi:uncharacterized protein C2orf42 homolog [Oppia nitens]|uniref:uncharacterized protein C2orf42 homolog n=1 Tax=Oppia nitens TaxID=1686743 RepID=UPI0023DC3F79|nr:uncharacterized protein C2orf42 homolog [Oppia nitens]